MKAIWAVARSVLAVALGNAGGYGAFRLAFLFTPVLWERGLNAATQDNEMGWRFLLTALTAIFFASPPVLIGALAARLAGRAGALIGAVCGLWAFGFAWWWPQPMPLLRPEAWIGPTVLVLLSGLMGGWLIETSHS